MIPAAAPDEATQTVVVVIGEAEDSVAAVRATTAACTLRNFIE
jgi:hypothetical protein